MKITSFLLLGTLLAPSSLVQADDVLVDSGPRSVLNLNGTWQILPVQGFKFEFPPPASGWKETPIPERVSPAINSIGSPYPPPVKELLNPAGTAFKQTDKIAAWYKRDFKMPVTPLTGERAVLHFHGRAFRSETWFNGTKIGTSVQGLVPVEYDVTALLKPGQTNSIVVGLAGREALVDIAAKSYIAPSSGVMAGIWGDVELRFIPDVSITDVFVKTFVGAKRLEVETTVSNAGKTARTVRPQVTILDSRGTAQTSIQGKPLALAPGQEKTVTLQKGWLASHLWTPDTPTLYNARVSLQSAGDTVDSYTQRFGFREFEIRGRDFFLNGTRVVLLRNSFLTDLAAPQESATTLVRENAGKPFNTARLHLGFNNEHIIDAADEIGLMINPEFAWYHTTNEFPVAQSALWLPNTLEYVRSFMRLQRNHPSITLWNLTNETFWGNTEDDMMKIGDQVLATVKALDPTRPQEGDGETTWAGRLPIINIHYPESTVGPLRAKYPNSGLLQPNDFYWLSKEGINTPWRSSFTWDRPLVLGEYYETGGGPEERFGFLGESGYDFEKWRQQDFIGQDGQNNEFMDVVKRSTDVYRMQGVAGLNPWAGDRQQIMPLVAVRPLDFHPNAFSGRTGNRKVVVFNDSSLNYAAMSLQCRLSVDGTTVWEKIISAPVGSGQNAVFDIAFECPTVQRATKATLSVRLRHERGARWTQLSRHEETIYILPIEKAASQDSAGVVLLDTKGTTATALRQLGLELTAKTQLVDADLAASKTLIVGAGTDAQPFHALISAFARRGGRVLLLSQNFGVPLMPELAQADDLHAATRSWKRAQGHPLFQDVNEAQLSYWLPDNIVSTQTLHKPTVGKFKVLLDSGGRYGLSWTPLLESAVGTGVVLQSQLNLVDRVAQEPMAGHLLLGMVRYLRDYKTATLQPLRVLIGKNEALQQVLTACSIATSAGLEGSGPVLLDSSYTPSADEIKQLKGYLDAGGKIWLHGFSSANIGTVSNLFPFKPALTKYDATVQSAARRSDDALISGISSQEFYWTRVELGAREDYYGSAQPTAKLGGEVLTLPNLEAGEKLIEPGLLVKVPSGKGTILFDTLLWENALGAENDKVSRLVTSLALNLGADVQVSAEKNYAYFQADLSQKMNMGFYDEVAGDGKGGWTDQGVNDLRYFLINHTGMLAGAAVGVAEFPTSATFAGRPFRLVDPKKNQGHSVITLRGQQNGPTFPTQVLDIAVGRKAEKLWFLQTACWATSDKEHQEIGRYIIHYEDGTEGAFPLRYGLELSDWWDPKPLSNSKVAWTGKNDMHSPVGVYVTEWTNPEPGKTIKSIDLIGSKTQTQIVLLGISGGTEIGASTTYKPIADWKLGTAKDGAVANEAGAGALKFGTPAPTVAGNALHFSHGQNLGSSIKAVPGLEVGGPFNLEITLTPEEKPDGYFGGIYQSADYLKSGFRLLLNQQSLLGVEIFAGDGKGRYLNGKTPLKFGQEYRIELRFDGQRGYLFLDGKLDASIDTPPPAPYAGEVTIGRAGGKDYNFNGSISRVVFGVPSG